MRIKCSNVYFDGERFHLDAADTLTRRNQELDVALITPGGVPGVFDDPVILVILSAVADGEDGMVEGVAAIAVVEDTSHVALEWYTACINGDRKGLHVESGLHLVDIVGGYGSVVRDSDFGSLGIFVSAEAAHVLVGVRRLKHGVVAILIVFISVLLTTTVAAEVTPLTASAVD